MWTLRPADPSKTQALVESLRLHPLVARVLVARGAGDPESARAFLTPRLADLTQPDGMADRAAAADRIARAVRAHERIVLFGDYDVDGTSSAALLHGTLTAMGGDVTALVASRFHGGYGLSQEAAQRIADVGGSLLITCDCGTSDHPRLEWLRARGFDVIVVDHHKVPEQALPAVAFLNPHRPDCGFPFKGLASVGLALSVAAAVRTALGASLDLRAWIDMVAVGTIADVMPLTGDNRILTRVGLDRLGQGAGCPGLKALAREARLTSRVRSHDVGFQIAPMLNAPGRLGSATPTLELLMSRTDEEASTRARVLALANEERRKVSGELVERATAQVVEVYGEDIPGGIVVGGDGWHPGVGGIVAGRLAERFGVPAIVIAVEGEFGVGSARGPKGFLLFDAVQRCATDLEQFGGHDGAAGMRLRRSRFDALRTSFADACAHVAATLGPIDDPADTTLTESDLVGPLAGHLEALEPTGQAHPEPTVLVEGARVSDVRGVGVGHLRARLTVGRVTIGMFIRDGVARRERGDLDWGDGQRADLVGRLRPDSYAGPDAVQIELKGARKSS